MRLCMLALATLLAGAALAEETSGNCSFDKGVNTCNFVTQTSETTTHTVYSGCVAGPTWQPGRRVTTYEDTYLVTTTRTTYQHGRNGKVFDESTQVDRVLEQSRQISTSCQPL